MPQPNKKTLILIEEPAPGPNPTSSWAKRLQLLSPPDGVTVTSLTDTQYDEIVDALDEATVDIQNYGINMADDEEERQIETRHLEEAQKLYDLLKNSD
jgi:hypothetical protein